MSGRMRDSPNQPGQVGWVYRIGLDDEYAANPIYIYGLALQFATAIFTTNSAPGYAETQLEVRASAQVPKYDLTFSRCTSRAQIQNY